MGPRITIQSALRPDYDPFFYRQLSRRARRIYRFARNTFSTLRKLLSLKPLSLATRPMYLLNPGVWTVFFPCTPRSLRTTFERNRNNVAERLGFLGRVIHGTNPRAWLKEVRQRVGEEIDFAAMAE